MTTLFNATHNEDVFNKVNAQLAKMNRRPLIVDEKGLLRLPQTGKVIGNVDNARLVLIPYLSKLCRIAFMDRLEDGLLDHIVNVTSPQFAEWYTPKPSKVMAYAKWLCGQLDITTKDQFEDLWGSGVVDEHFNDYWMD